MKKTHKAELGCKGFLWAIFLIPFHLISISIVFLGVETAGKEYIIKNPFASSLFAIPITIPFIDLALSFVTGYIIHSFKNIRIKKKANIHTSILIGFSFSWLVLPLFIITLLYIINLLSK